MNDNASDLTQSTTPPAPSPDDTQMLESGDETTSLPAPEQTLNLPDGYEVPVLSAGSVTQDVAQAEAFGESLVAVQNLISRYSQQYDELKKKIQELNESFKNLFENDTDLQELEAKAKTVTQDVTQKRQRVKESPEAVQLLMKTKELKEEKKEIEEALNNHLLQYYQLTGSQVIEEADGSEREFSINARLKAKKAA